MLKMLLAAALILTGAATTAAAAEPVADSEKMVCKRVKETTGWRLSTSSKVCKKKKEWEAESRDAQRNARDEARGDD